MGAGRSRPVVTTPAGHTDAAGGSTTQPPTAMVGNVEVLPSPAKSPRRAAYQKVKSVADLGRFVKREPSKKSVIAREDSKGSFTDLLKFRKQGALLSMSNHSDDITLESILHEQQQRQNSQSDQNDTIPAPPLAVTAQPQAQNYVSPEHAERTNTAIEEFEKKVQHWITVFDLITVHDFERAVMGELLTLVAIVPVCANYIFWIGFCTVIQRRMKISGTARIMQILRRVHPHHNLPPLGKKKTKTISRSRVGDHPTHRGGRGQGRGGRGGGRARGGRGGRGRNGRESTLKRPSGERYEC